jgi:hypothetical protein
VVNGVSPAMTVDGTVGFQGAEYSCKIAQHGLANSSELNQPPPKTGKLLALPVLGGVQRDYRLAA